jgi:putative heme-binding domain-containing protein
MFSCRCAVFGVAFLLLLVCVARGEDPFAAGVRPTEPLSPAEEQRSFTLPPGFEIQLVAAEPQIQKPLNLAFDARGRLWVTDTVEYPYAAPPDRPGRDSIKILEDTNGDGAADRVITFAEGLNIPIGLYPYKNGVVAYSIPNIYFFEDTDGDDRCDRQTKLFGPFDYSRDTHGMQNAFRRGLDGWLYACHGFNNQSKVSGADGRQITMNSGNTYRMRLDGSHIDHFTWGQVNPFGMTMDPLGNLFTADCHSKPVYQLLRGGYYPSFGAPHDGLGFVPPMMEHLHGSTAIAGVLHYADDRFPPEFRGNLFSGNVMTSRINRNSLEYRGSTIAAREEPDFVATTDPWFRPVDLQLAADGSMYVADFYNRIIGHYEVPLTHPGRDRHRGRIWRVVYRGENSDPAPRKNLANSDVPALIAALGSSNLTERLLATNELTDRVGAVAAPALDEAFQAAEQPQARVHALAALFRIGNVRGDLWTRAVQDSDRAVRVHALKLLAEETAWSDEQRQLALSALHDEDAFVRRAAADALGQHSHPSQVTPLIELLNATTEQDVLLRHTARIALKYQFLDELVIASLPALRLDDATLGQVADVMIAVRSPQAAAFLIDYLEQHETEAEKTRQYVEHAARYMAPEKIDDFAKFARERFPRDPDLQNALLTALRDGLAQRGLAAPATLRAWAAELASRLFDASAQTADRWTNTPLPQATKRDNPWVLQQRVSDDGDDKSLFLCSLPRGEQLTGVLRSPEFIVPAKLSFFTAGHNGFPTTPLVPRNIVRLRDASTNEILVEATPPRHDTAHRIVWDLASFAGRRGYVEIVDGDDRGAYAWLAVGRFSPAVVAMPAYDPAQPSLRDQAAARLVRDFQLEELAPRLPAMLQRKDGDAATQKALAEAILAVRPNSVLAALAAVLDDAALAPEVRHRAVEAIAQQGHVAVEETLAKAFQESPQRVQAVMAQSLAATPEGAAMLVTLAERGAASPRLLTLSTVARPLAAHQVEALSRRVQRLAESLPPANVTLLQLMAQRREQHQGFVVSLERGAQVFEKQCATCHQVAGKGAVIGPQLDGIGNRGLERLLEDVLAPNQNVDVAFRVTTFALADGRIVSGLVRREEGEVLIVADNQGKEIKIPKSDIDEQAQTALSLMPENVAEIVPEDDFHHLVGFLLQQRGPGSAEPAPSGDTR